MSQFTDACETMPDTDKTELKRLFGSCVVNGRSNQEIEEEIVHRWREYISQSHPDNDSSDDSRRLFSFLQGLRGDDKTGAWAGEVRKLLSGERDLFEIESVRFDGKTAQCISGLRRSFFGNSLRIPEGITVIADGAFWERQDASSVPKSLGLVDIVIIPRSVRVISENAFRCCMMKEVLFEHGPEDELFICPGAFSGCERLKEINPPLRTTYYVSSTSKSHRIFEKTRISPETLGKWPASWRCCYTNGTPAPLSWLFPRMSLLILEGFSEIPDSFFQNLEELKEIRGMEGVSEIGNKAFFNCRSLKRVKLPDTLKVIGDNAFGKCRELEYIDIPDSVEYVGSRAFGECASLKACVISRDREFLLPEDVFSGYDYGVDSNKDSTKARKALIVYRSRKPEIKRYKKEAVCPSGFSRILMAVSPPEGKELCAITVSVPAGEVIACIGPQEEGWVTINCLNPGRRPVHACLEVLAQYF